MLQDKDGDANITMQNNSGSILNDRKWNRRLMNLLWMFTAIIFVMQITDIIYDYQKNPIPPIAGIGRLLIPPLSICFLTAACELAVKRLERGRQSLQPYVIITAVVLICADLLIIHYHGHVVFVVYALPLFFALVYHNKRILRYAFLASLCVFAGAYAESYNRVTLHGLSFNIATLCVAYLVSETVRNRLEEARHARMEAERAAYEAETAKARAEAAVEAKTRLLSNMSRALCAPLSGMTGLSELALEDGPMTEEQKACLQKIKGQSDRLLAVINDVADMTKIDTGETVLQRLPFDLHSVLNECEAAMAQKAADKGLRLYFYNEAKLSHKIIGDAARLRRVLLIFLSNAVKFTEHGSVTLVAKLDGEAEKDGAVRIIFEISDTGIGMTEEQLEKLFVPFHQVDSSDTSGFGGIGLGLCIAKHIIGAMGGGIEVRSIADIGSRFSFSLAYDLSHEKSAPEDREAFRMLRPIFDGTALLCEDDEINQQITVQNLEQLGLRVIVAENGQEGVDAACMYEQEGKPFDVILMDIHMPVMDGLQAVNELVKRNVNAPVIAMTANGAAEDRERYLNAGMSGYLSKPIKAHALRSCLLAHLTPVAALDETAEEPETQQAVRHEDNAAVDAVIGVENFAGSKPTYMQALDTFSKKYVQTPSLLEQAVADQDFALAQRTAHTEKGAAAIIGAHKLSELLAVLEEAFRRDGQYFKRVMMDEYQEEHAKVLLCISELLL